MFDDVVSGWCDESLQAEDDLAFEVSCRELADGWSDEDRQVLPDGFEGLALSCLAVVVRSVDRGRLNGHDAVRLMRAEARLESAFGAEKLASVAEVALSCSGGPEAPVRRCDSEVEYAADEVAPALTLTRRAAEALVDQALVLRWSLCRVWERFSGGGLSYVKVREFIRILGHLPVETIDGVLDLVLDRAAELTTGQLRARLQRLVLEADPDGSAHAMVEGLEDRKVVSYQNPDLTGSLSILNAHPNDVASARAFIHGLARQLKTGQETRTLEQIENDVALDLLQGRHFTDVGQGGVRTIVTVPLATLQGLSDEPGELNGYGPVTAEIARKVAVDNTDGDWMYIATDNGLPVATGTLASRPTESQKRRIRAEYPTCIWPGCRQPAAQSDIDHRKPRSEGGATDNHNLGPLCRHHHMVRHARPWRLERRPNGDHQWTSPLGHTYISQGQSP